MAAPQKSNEIIPKSVKTEKNRMPSESMAVLRPYTKQKCKIMNIR